VQRCAAFKLGSDFEPDWQCRPGLLVDRRRTPQQPEAELSRLSSAAARCGPGMRGADDSDRRDCQWDELECTGVFPTMLLTQRTSKFHSINPPVTDESINSRQRLSARDQRNMRSNARCSNHRRRDNVVERSTRNGMMTRSRTSLT
jgi:hypothetical protein